MNEKDPREVVMSQEQQKEHAILEQRLLTVFRTLTIAAQHTAVEIVEKLARILEEEASESAEDGEKDEGCDGR